MVLSIHHYNPKTIKVLQFAGKKCTKFWNIKEINKIYAKENDKEEVKEEVKETVKDKNKLNKIIYLDEEKDIISLYNVDKGVSLKTY